MSDRAHDSSASGAEEQLARSKTGRREPTGVSASALFVMPLLWSCFQLWYASPLPFMFDFLLLNDTEARSIHLGFAIFLAFLAFPALKRSPRDRIPARDWLLAAIGTACAVYLYVFYVDLAERAGAPTWLDFSVGITGMIVLLEATRRALGPPLTVVATVFLVYAFAGPYMPDVIAHKGASLSKAVSHYWLSTEGVFGIAVGVSTSFVFMFVLFGALLEKAGAGSYFIRVAFSLLGHMRGGPAKAAVVASGMTGMVSGSSIANVVTTGTFTIPLMKRVGFSPEKAGAVEVASSTNGQLTPPIMGAAAFLMIEYVGISYLEVIKHAALPALISYIALIYIVHLEAMKADIRPLRRRHASSFKRSATTLVTTVAGLAVAGAALYFGIAWLKAGLGSLAPWVLAALAMIAYIGTLWYGASQGPLGDDFADPTLETPPDPGPTIRSGLHYLLPVIVLVWCLTVERLSPGLSAFWATLFMMFITVTQPPLLAILKGGRSLASAFGQGLRDLVGGLSNGACNMIGIGVATAAAGIVVGTVTLTGIGLVMTEFVEFISGGILILILLFTALISLVLGMGLPTTANYIVVSTLMAPVIVELGAQNGLIVPLIAVHMFVFYFGILADDTPPVGLAAFAGAAIARSDPVKTGLQGFFYDIRTAILPFMFIFNTQLLLIGIDHWWELLLTVAGAITAMLAFAAATQGFFLARNRIWETLLLLVVAFTLLRPGYWVDLIVPPWETMEPKRVVRIAETLAPEAAIRLHVEGETIDGDYVRTVVALPLGPAGDGMERLRHGGIAVRLDEDGRVVIESVRLGSVADNFGVDFDWLVTAIALPAEQPPKQLMFVPAILLLTLVAGGQYIRRKKS